MTTPATGPAPHAGPTTFRPLWIKLDVKKATQLLGHGGNFRRPDLQRVARLLDEMKAGRFAWEMEPFAMLSDQRNLIDGQHRLLAYVQFLEGGGDEQVVEIRFDAPDAWSHLLDAGRPRTTSQRVKNTGVVSATLVTSAVSGLWYVATHGALQHADQPASFVLNLLGPSEEESTPQRDTIHEAARLYSRLYDAFDPVSRRAFGSQPVITALTLMLHWDREGAQQYAADMLQSLQWSPDRGTHGAAAASALLRSTMHLSEDRNRWGQKARTLQILMLTFLQPKLAYGTLERKFLSRDSDRMDEKLRAVIADQGQILIDLANSFIGDAR